MNTLKALPNSLLRPSRSSSPAPPHTTTSDAHPHLKPNVEHVPSGLGSRSNSGSGRSRSLTRGFGVGLGLTSSGASIGSSATGTDGKRDVSPSSSRPVTPHLGHAQLPDGVPPPISPNVPEISPGLSSAGGVASAGIIDAIGLRLNEGVNKCCLGVDWKAKKGFKKGSGWSLGELVVKEVPPPSSDAFFLRAVLRTAIRSLTIYISRLEFFLLPAISDPTFSSPLVLTYSTVPAPPLLLNVPQAFAVSVCHAAWETCEVLEIALETNPYPRFVGEMLRPTMDKLDSIVARVVTPLMGNLKKELLKTLEVGYVPSPRSSHAKLSAIGAGTTSSGTSHGTTTAVNGVSSTLAPTLPTKALPHIPPTLLPFASRIDGARKIFELVCKECKEDGEAWIASVVVAVVWKGLCLCTAKYGVALGWGAGSGSGNRAPSPETVGKALASLAVKDASAAGGTSTPIGGGPNTVGMSASGAVGAVGKMASILPSRAVASRPPSPPRKGGGDHGPASNATAGRNTATPIPPTALALASFEALINRLVGGLVQKPKPLSASMEQEPEHLAREALDEALSAINDMKMVVSALEQGHVWFSGMLKNLKDDIAMPSEKEEEVLDATEDCPAVFLFNLLQIRVNKAVKESGIPGNGKLMIRNPCEVIGFSEEEYERQVLGGFGIAEERAKRVAMAYKSELERISSDLNAMGEKDKEDLKEFRGWCRALALALVAREGVVVVNASF